MQEQPSNVSLENTAKNMNLKRVAAHKRLARKRSSAGVEAGGADPASNCSLTGWRREDRHRRLLRPSRASFNQAAGAKFDL